MDVEERLRNGVKVKASGKGFLTKKIANFYTALHSMVKTDNLALTQIRKCVPGGATVYSITSEFVTLIPMAVNTSWSLDENTVVRVRVFEKWRGPDLLPASISFGCTPRYSKFRSLRVWDTFTSHLCYPQKFAKILSYYPGIPDNFDL
ncbi:hypothetical protein CYMTET_47824 [Cymbomonas tetramitiformis]|uniref:Uncharacterized protein n=1 Tax=Cymbomonas tetramitiformis TaxID=36881 RepID=A0AAE0BVB9_9CHLO|nr:hypothetical protein CYMTET_47824 [Cymbomonas tetramitiformis]